MNGIYVKLFIFISCMSCSRNVIVVKTSQEYVYKSDKVEIAYIFFPDSTFYYQLRFSEHKGLDRSSYGKWNQFGETVILQTSIEKLKPRIIPSVLEVLDSVKLDISINGSLRGLNRNTGLYEVYKPSNLNVIDTAEINRNLLP